MTLYHGTNADIDTIDLNKGLQHKDFGKGFCRQQKCYKISILTSNTSLEPNVLCSISKNPM